MESFLSTQEHQQIIPKAYLAHNIKTALATDSIVDKTLPPVLSPSAFLPNNASLSMNPPNIPRREYFRGAEQAYLHSSPDFKRDLSYLKQRWVFYQAANRGHIPTLVVRSKKGPKTVKITNWVENVLYHAKQVDDLLIAILNSTKTSTTTAVNNFNHFWSDAIFDPVQHSAICYLRNSFEQEDLGIMCLASMSHVKSTCFGTPC
jgi:hypothetical protein